MASVPACRLARSILQDGILGWGGQRGLVVSALALSVSRWKQGRRPHRSWGYGCSPLLSVSTAELMERAAVPPLWPALYPPGRSPLHHAQQLQLFSQQHFLRQQELLYLQQQAAQALELQRSAQLVQERLKTQEHQTQMEEKISKRGLESTGKAGLSATGPGLLPHKSAGLATGPTGTHGKAMSPPPSP